jgi:hypothetical protein
VVVEERSQEVELPMRVTVNYMDVATDYQQGTQAAKRIINPTPTMQSMNEMTIQFPIVFTASEAEQLAERLLFTVWNERIRYSWKAPWEHLDLNPADVVTLNLTGGATTVALKTRIVDAKVSPDFVIEFKGLKEEAATSISTTTADGALGVPFQSVVGPFFTLLFLLDIPLLRDIDDTGRSSSRLHIAMNGFSGNWPGGVLYDSPDLATFSNTGVKNLVGVSYGTVINKLPTTTVPFQTDTTTQLQVLMTDGTLSSVTEAQFLNGANAALVGDRATGNWEVILFQTATQQADSSYILSTIMRARRGTDVNVNSHNNGEFFLFLDTAALTSVLLKTGDLNISRFYKGVGFGQLPENADVEVLASTMADLKPYAPAQLTAVPDVSDNIDLAWVRRTRVGGDLRDGGGTVPLAEDTEEYEVDILDAPGGTVVRPFTGLITPAVEYTKANLVTDIGVTTGVTALSVLDTSTFQRAAGSFITDGFQVGDTIETTGFTTGANNGEFVVKTVSANVMQTVTATLVVEGAGVDEEIEVIRQKDLTFVVYQISAQIGRGFPAEATIIL